MVRVARALVIAGAVIIVALIIAGAGAVIIVALRRTGAGAVIVVSDAVFSQHAEQIAGLAAKHRLPSAAAYQFFAEAGCLMTYGANRGDLSRRAAIYVDKIFKGANPAALPVEQPTKFEFVINRKTAKALGLTIPQSLLISADKVIE